jgi:hypothetical protein
MDIMGNIQNNIVVIYEIKSFLCNLSSGEIFPNNIHGANYHFTYSKKLEKNPIIPRYHRWVVLCTVKDLIIVKRPHSSLRAIWRCCSQAVYDRYSREARQPWQQEQEQCTAQGHRAPAGAAEVRGADGEEEDDRADLIELCRRPGATRREGTKEKT